MIAGQGDHKAGGARQLPSEGGQQQPCGADVDRVVPIETLECDVEDPGVQIERLGVRPVAATGPSYENGIDPSADIRVLSAERLESQTPRQRVRDGLILVALDEDAADDER